MQDAYWYWYSLLCYMEANGITKERIESLPASELNHFLSTFFMYKICKMEKSTSVFDTLIFQDRQKPVKFRYKSFLKFCLWSTWFTFNKLLFSNSWLEVRLNKKQTSMVQVPYNTLLTNPASSNRTEEYWPSVRTKTTSGQYSPVRPSRSVRG